jgi:hypothetical protein
LKHSWKPFFDTSVSVLTAFAVAPSTVAVRVLSEQFLVADAGKGGEKSRKYGGRSQTIILCSQGALCSGSSILGEVMQLQIFVKNSVNACN